MQGKDDQVSDWVRYKRDTINPIEALEGQGAINPAVSTTPAANTTLKYRTEFQQNLNFFNAIQQKLIMLAFPVINGISNSTNDTLTHNLVWQAFAEVVNAPLFFKSPFKLNGNYVLTIEKQLFNGSSADNIYAKPNRTAQEEKFLNHIEDLDSFYIFCMSLTGTRLQLQTQRAFSPNLIKYKVIFCLKINRL